MNKKHMLWIESRVDTSERLQTSRKQYCARQQDAGDPHLRGHYEFSAPRRLGAACAPVRSSKHCCRVEARGRKSRSHTKQQDDGSGYKNSERQHLPIEGIRKLVRAHGQRKKAHEKSRSGGCQHEAKGYTGAG